MFIICVGASCLYVGAELYAQGCKFADKLGGLAVVGDVAECFVLVERLGVVQFMVRLVGVLVGAAVRLGVECRHNADATHLVLGVHIVTLVAQGGKVHSGTGAHAVDEGDDLLSLGVGVFDGLLIVVLCPCRTTGRVDDEYVSAAERMVGCTHHHVAVVYGAIGATAAVARDRAINGEDGDKRVVLFVLIVQCPLAFYLLAILGNLVFLGAICRTVCRLSRDKAAMLLGANECGVRIQVLLQSLAYAMHEVGTDHPLFLRKNLVKTFHVCCKIVFVLLS